MAATTTKTCLMKALVPKFGVNPVYICNGQRRTEKSQEHGKQRKMINSKAQRKAFRLIQSRNWTSVVNNLDRITLIYPQSLGIKDFKLSNS